jgi:hypothetical protein
MHWLYSGLLLAACASVCTGQTRSPATPSNSAREFLASQGFTSPPPLYVQALDTFLEVEGAYRRGDYEAAGRALDALWAAHPAGEDEWARAYREAGEIGRTRGINVGCPPCYYALRMLTECVRWRRSPEASAKPVSTAALTVLLVDRASGIEPSTTAELAQGGGTPQKYRLEPSLLTDGSRIIRDSLWLFTEYIRAASNGKLDVRVRTLHLRDLEVPVAVTSRGGPRFAGLAGDAWSRIWAAVPAAIRNSTDWWWIIYPSCVPERHPDFATAEFITGGMGTGPDGVSPCFIIDDRWLTRKPPHLGKGPYTEIERRAYLPQWLQHEFMHHLFRIYPAFGLEVQGHQWFNRSTWPQDFHGRIEPDYYAEAMAKRMQPKGDPPLHVALKYAPPPARLFRSIRLEDLVGEYRHEPAENDWHIGVITLEKADNGTQRLRWTNRAGKSWMLTPDLAHGVLRTGPDCPYYEASDPDGNPFRIRLMRDRDGRWLPALDGFSFQGGLYRRSKNSP